MPCVALTGGPGVGKTTLLAALRDAGHATVAESARALIAERRASGQSPRPPPAEFARELVRRDTRAYTAAAAQPGWVFFDRGLVDSLGLLWASGAADEAAIDAQLQAHPFHRIAFVLPPWPAIYATDAERDQSFADCQRIHGELVAWYARWGFALCEVPPAPVAQRMDFVLGRLRDGAAAADYAASTAAPRVGRPEE